MRANTLIIIVLGLFVACNASEKNEQENYQINFSMDTVKVDSKGELLFVAYSLSLSDFSKNQKYLYNFSMDNHSVEVIDMDKLEFVQRLPFEKEGPNGVGGYVGTIQRVGENSFFLSSSESKGIFDFEGKQIQNLKQKAEDFNEEFLYANSHAYIPNTNQLIGNFSDWDSGKKFVGIANFDKKNFKSLALKKFDFLENFSTWLVSENGGKMGQMGHWVIPSFINEKYIISTNITSDFYVYDILADSLSFIEFNHKLFPKIKSGTFPRETSSTDEFKALSKNYKKGINYALPIWDSENEVYYRFAYSYPDSDIEDPQATVYLIILDESYKILNEVEVPALKNSPSYYFAKDGMIWFFENMDDEIGFVRLSLN